MRPPGKPQTLEKRRLRAIRLLEEGESFRDVADQVHASLSSVVRWHQAYQKNGKEGLQPRPIPGRPPGLSDRDKEKLVRILLAGPLKAGYATDLWTLKRIGQVIQRHFGTRYGRSNLWKLMRSLGWSCQKPEKRARERNEQAIRTWKRHVWPHIKKGQTTSGPSGVPR